MSKSHAEQAFETAIEHHLTAAGPGVVRMAYRSLSLTSTGPLPGKKTGARGVY